MASRFSKKEKDYIRDNYGANTAKQVARRLYARCGVRRTEGGVWAMAKSMGIKKDEEPKPPRSLSYAGIVMVRTIESPDNFPSMDRMKISIQPADLIGAMTNQECNSYVVAGVIKRATGYNVTANQVTEMQVRTGMPEKYATDKVKRFLGLC